MFLGQAGNEYDNAKVVYLSPQIAGFDFGLQYAPNTSNGFGMGGSNIALNSSITGSGTGTGLTLRGGELGMSVLVLRSWHRRTARVRSTRRRSVCATRVRSAAWACWPTAST